MRNIRQGASEVEHRIIQLNNLEELNDDARSEGNGLPMSWNRGLSSREGMYLEKEPSLISALQMVNSKA